MSVLILFGCHAGNILEKFEEILLIVYLLQKDHRVIILNFNTLATRNALFETFQILAKTQPTMKSICPLSSLAGSSSVWPSLVP